MGRELKRVPLWFDAPMNKVWKGFINPYNTSIKCEHCDGLGYSEYYNHLKDLWYGYAKFKPEDNGSTPFLPTDQVIIEQAKWNISRAPEYYGTTDIHIQRECERLSKLFNTRWHHHLNQQEVNALIAEGRLHDLTSEWKDDKWQRKVPEYNPTAKEVNDWSIKGFGHDGINAWIVISQKCLDNGQSTKCHHCGGEGCTWPSKSDKYLHDTWKWKQPPKGKGYQIWETVSEGSPISPVFKTPEELAEHMSHTRWGADQGSTKEQWLEFILGPGWAPSGVIKNGVSLNPIAIGKDD
jgi:hypothetical protein